MSTVQGLDLTGRSFANPLPFTGFPLLMLTFYEV